MGMESRLSVQMCRPDYVAMQARNNRGERNTVSQVPLS
jgi:hypothetical protein